MLGLPTVDNVSLCIVAFVNFHSMNLSNYVFKQGMFFHEF